MIHFNFNEGMFCYPWFPVVCVFNEGGYWLYLAAGIPWWKYGVIPWMDSQEKMIYYSPKLLIRIKIKKGF